MPLYNRTHLLTTSSSAMLAYVLISVYVYYPYQLYCVRTYYIYAPCVRVFARVYDVIAVMCGMLVWRHRFVLRRW